MSGITIDKDSAIPIYSPVCARCKHWRPNAGEHGRTCAAYQAADSIPMPIWTGENDHTKPYPGDGGIRFESAK